MENQPNLKHEASCLLVKPVRTETTLNPALYSSPHVVGASALIRGLRKALNGVCVAGAWGCREHHSRRAGLAQSTILSWQSSLSLLVAPCPAPLALDLNISIFRNQGQIERSFGDFQFFHLMHLMNLFFFLHLLNL